MPGHQKKIPIKLYRELMAGAIYDEGDRVVVVSGWLADKQGKVLGARPSMVDWLRLKYSVLLDGAPYSISFYDDELKPLQHEP